MIEHLIAEAQALWAAQRRQQPDAPGSAPLVDLSERAAAPAAYRAFRRTPAGAYLLSIIESYESALNDEWLPFAITGLPLDKAKIFIQAVVEQLQHNSLEVAVANLQTCYTQLSLESHGMSTDKLTQEEIADIINRIKAGDTYVEVIFEGQIIYCYEEGIFKEKTWQSNPYTGELKERNDEVPESALVNYFSSMYRDTIIDQAFIGSQRYLGLE